MMGRRRQYFVKVVRLRLEVSLRRVLSYILLRLCLDPFIFQIIHKKLGCHCWIVSEETLR